MKGSKTAMSISPVVKSGKNLITGGDKSYSLMTHIMTPVINSFIIKVNQVLSLGIIKTELKNSQVNWPVYKMFMPSWSLKTKMKCKTIGITTQVRCYRPTT